MAGFKDALLITSIIGSALAASILGLKHYYLEQRKKDEKYKLSKWWNVLFGAAAIVENNYDFWIVLVLIGVNFLATFLLFLRSLISI